MTESEAQAQIARDLDRIGDTAGRIADAGVGGFGLGVMLALGVLALVCLFAALPLDDTAPDRGGEQ